MICLRDPEIFKRFFKKYLLEIILRDILMKRYADIEREWFSEIYPG